MGNKISLQFNGQTLTLEEDGVSFGSFTAISGKPGYSTPEYQGFRNHGPIPEGTYNLGPVQRASPADIIVGLIGKIAAPFEIKVGAWPGGPVAWGQERIDLTPVDPNAALGRSGFTIHGGWYPGSAGCIDLTASMPLLADVIENIGLNIQLVVKYEWLHTIADARALDRDTMQYYVSPKDFYNSPSEGQTMRPGTNPAPHTIADARAQERDYANSQGSRPSVNPNDTYTSVLADVANSGRPGWGTNGGTGSTGGGGHPYTGGGGSSGSSVSGGRGTPSPTTGGAKPAKDYGGKDEGSKLGPGSKPKDKKPDNDPGKKGPQPVVLDLDGNGFEIDTLGTSSTFVAMDETGLLTRTAWARGNDGVLVIDANGDGKISNSKEFVFTEWAPTGSRGCIRLAVSMVSLSGKLSAEAGGLT